MPVCFTADIPHMQPSDDALIGRRDTYPTSTTGVPQTARHIHQSHFKRERQRNHSSLYMSPVHVSCGMTGAQKTIGNGAAGQELIRRPRYGDSYAD